MSKTLLLLIKLVGGFVGVCFGLMIVVGFPFAIVYGVNTLFPASNIPYNFNTWISAFMLWVLFGRTPSDWVANKQAQQDKDKTVENIDVERL